MGYLLKLARAEEHINRLKAAVDGRIEQKPYATFPDFDTNTREHVIRAKILIPIPETWSLDVGDILHNLRSALDHLAFELACSHKGSPLTSIEAKRSEFPIFGERAPTSKQWSDRIGLCHPGAQAIIRNLQPYKSFDYRDHCLWIISALNNIDKHRTLHIVTSTLAGFDISLSGKAHLRKLVPPASGLILEDNTELARILAYEDMNAETNMGIGECFNEPSMRPKIVPVDQGCRTLLNFIKEIVVPPLRPYL